MGSPIGQTHNIQTLRHTRLDFFKGPTRNFQRKSHVIGHSTVAQQIELLKHHADVLPRLAQLGRTQCGQLLPAHRYRAAIGAFKQVDQPTGLRLASSNREAWLDVDKDTLYEHQTNLEKRLAETRQQIANLSGRLANENYVNKAPAHLIEETRKELEQKEAYEVRLQAELSVLSD